MYMLGGVEKIDGEAELLKTRSMLRLDRGSQTWSEVEPMPRAVCNGGTCVLGSNIFVLDGEMSVESTFCYTAPTNVEKTLGPMPGAKMGHGVCVLSGLIYTFRGSTTSDQNARVLSSVHRFDPAATLWSTVAPILSFRVAFASFLLGGSTYVTGGFGGDDDLSSVECYNVASDSWEVVGDMALSGARLDSSVQVRMLQMGLFDSLEIKSQRART
jgi:hypothetical protein